MRISVALCTHNGAEFVVEQVTSILDQSRPVDEIVLSDDASTDATVELVERTLAQWVGAKPVLRVIRNVPALGVLANFEQAIGACTGELIALCDQDDVWRSDRLELIAALFEADPRLLLVHSDARLVSGTGETIGGTLLESLEMTAREHAELGDGRSFDALLRRNLVTGATVVLRASVLPAALPFGPSWIHDEWIAIVAAAVGSTRLLDDRLVDYRQHGGNQIGARKPTLGYKIGKLLEPRASRNDNLVSRDAQLVARLEELGDLVPEERLRAARGRLDHDRSRAALPRTRIARVPAVIGAMLSGSYARFGRGLMDALRDLTQPSH